ncbi:unnamed protein product [Clonostachys solani]|uniref:DUF7924 domain-containing protein n=1 Tax=Clonostachys solani TaxID=160281 RepID=A0A9P0ECM3_9HYPO|nr:unnamed protein product [Clonostachys solani]
MAAQGQTTQPKGGSHSWKRQHPGEPSPQEDSPPICCKRQRTDSCSGSELSWKYPPRFWDRLSSIPLVHNALEELERRTHKRPSFPSRPILPEQKLIPSATGELARFARHGGPDLHDLRGYPHATRRHRPADAMSSPSRHQGANATDPSTLPTPVTTPTSRKSTSPYDAAFEQHLADHQVHPPTYASQGPEWAEVMAALARPRPSLSQSMFPPTSFSTFQAKDMAAKSEAAVLRNVIPTITGSDQADHLCCQNTLFGNLKPLTDGTIVTAKPDIYYGADPKDLDRSIRDELAGHIIPSTSQDRPMAPNFFLEVKGPGGNQAVTTRQACYAGAIGSRAMHSLQNYNEKQPRYGTEHTAFSSFYHSGTLKIFAHHITAPSTPEGQPEYHMIKLHGSEVTGSIDNFRSGVGAFRNARDLAKQYRDRFIQEANARGPRARLTAAQADSTEPRQGDIWAPHGSVDPTQCIPLQDADDDELQQQIDEGDGEPTPTVSHHLHTEDDFERTSKDLVAPGDDPSLSFASSSTSNSSAVRRRSKRLEQTNQGLCSGTRGNHTSKNRS